MKKHWWSNKMIVILIRNILVIGTVINLITCKPPFYKSNTLGDGTHLEIESTGYDLSMFSGFKLELREISKNEYQSHEKKKKMNILFSDESSILGRDIYLEHGCDEICSSYIMDISSKKGIELPTSFDEGISGMILSPSRKQLIIYSSVGSHYEPYNHRAELFGFEVTKNGGIKGLKPSFKYMTKDFEISSLFWVNEKIILLTVNENNWDDQSSLRYFRVKIAD
jgi:hypothetical protein